MNTLAKGGIKICNTILRYINTFTQRIKAEFLRVPTSSKITGMDPLCPSTFLQFFASVRNTTLYIHEDPHIDYDYKHSAFSSMQKLNRLSTF